MFLDQVIHFGKYLGDQVKRRSPKELKSLTEFPYLALLSVQALSFNVTLFPFPQRVPRPSYSFREKFGRSGKCRSQKNLKSLIEVPYVVNVKVHVLGSYTENAKIVGRGSLRSARESTGSKLQHEPYLFSIACS